MSDFKAKMHHIRIPLGREVGGKEKGMVNERKGGESCPQFWSLDPPMYFMTSCDST